MEVNSTHSCPQYETEGKWSTSCPAILAPGNVFNNNRNALFVGIFYFSLRDDVRHIENCFVR